MAGIGNGYGVKRRGWVVGWLLGTTALALAGCSWLPAPSVTVTWTVESEQGVAGYNVLRAESAGGPFAQVNRTLIPVAGDPVVSHAYSYADRDVVCGKAYWYKLQEVEVSGARLAIEGWVAHVVACSEAR